MVTVMDLLDANCLITQQIVPHPALGDIEAWDERLLQVQFPRAYDFVTFTLEIGPELGLEGELWASTEYFNDDRDNPLTILLRDHSVPYGVI